MWAGLKMYDLLAWLSKGWNDRGTLAALWLVAGLYNGQPMSQTSVNSRANLCRGDGLLPHEQARRPGALSSDAHQEPARLHCLLRWSVFSPAFHKAASPVARLTRHASHHPPCPCPPFRHTRNRQARTTMRPWAWQSR